MTLCVSRETLSTPHLFRAGCYNNSGHSHLRLRKQSLPLQSQRRRGAPLRKKLTCIGASQSAQQRVEDFQEESSQKLEDALDNVEESLDPQVAEALSGLVGRHTFDEDQQEVFRYLVKQMRQCASGLIALAGVVVLLVIKQVMEGDPHPMPGISLGGVAISRLSNALNASLVAALMWAGAVSFKKVFKADDNQLAYAFQGIIQLSVIFMQIAPITLSFAVVNIVEASVRWPEVATLVAVSVAATTVIRASSLAVLLSRYMPGNEGTARLILALRQGWKGLRKLPLFPDRAALVVSAGLLLPYSTPDFATSVSKSEKPEEAMKGGPDADQDADEAAQEEHSSQQGRAQNSRQDGDDQHHSQQQQKGNKDGASKEAEPAFSRAEGHKEGSESAENGDSAGKGQGGEYEFTRWEERVLEVVMDAMRMSALALMLQALSSCMLGVAVAIQSNPWNARTYFMNDLVDQVIRSTLLFASAGCFRRVADSSGQDITHLLEGLGKDHGLGKLFNRMQKLAWGMAMFKSLDLILPPLMATQLWQRVQAWLVRQVVEYVPKGAQLTAAMGL